jgi:hypothetical protein
MTSSGVNTLLPSQPGIGSAFEYETPSRRHSEPAVNIDPEAPIFGIAHCGACRDVVALAEALEKEFN